MQKISSKKTFFYKKIFPLLWFGIIAMVTAMMLFLPPKKAAFPLPFLVAPLFMMGVGYFFMKKIVFDLMDEVYDDGDKLIVKMGETEDSIALSNVINVTYSIALNPPRIVLMLRTPCRFGKKVAFCPPSNWDDMKSLGFNNTLAEQLITRVDTARRSAQL